MARLNVAHPDAIDQIKDYHDHLLEVGKSYNTIRLYVKDLRDFADFIKMPLWPKPASFDKLVGAWLEKRRDQGDSMVSLRRRIYAIRSFYTYAGIPHITAKLSIPKLKTYLPEILTPEETDAVLHQAQQIQYEVFLFIRLMLLLGLKSFEAHSIRLTDEQLESKRIQVTDEKNETRYVVVGEEAAGLLEEFVNEGNRWYMSRSSLLKGVGVAAMMAGCPHATPHNLRSTCAARMILSGYPKDFIRANMGYKSNYTLDLIQRLLTTTDITGEDMVF